MSSGAACSQADGVEALWRQVDSAERHEGSSLGGQTGRNPVRFSRCRVLTAWRRCCWLREIVRRFRHFPCQGRRRGAAHRGNSNGATDYVLKSSMRRLGTAVKRAPLRNGRGATPTKRESASCELRTRFRTCPTAACSPDRAAQAIAHARRTGRTLRLIVAEC